LLELENTQQAIFEREVSLLFEHHRDPTNITAVVEKNWYVSKGEKYIATQWIDSRLFVCGLLPFGHMSYRTAIN
jgi:hypothetical protein